MGKENIIYYPSETPEQKQAAKKHEEKAREESGRRLHAVSKEEAGEFVKTAEKLKKGSVGMSRAEMRDWWKGKGEGRGARDLAETVFDYFLSRINAFERKETKKPIRKEAGEKDFIITKEVKPFLEYLAKDVILHRAQEDILLHLMDEWRPQVVPEVKIKIWNILQDYLKEFSAKEDVSDDAGKKPKEEASQKDKQETDLEPDHRLYAISKEEAKGWVDDVEKTMKKKMGGRGAGEFKKWWLGESGGGVGEGAEKLAEWIFNQISYTNVFDALLENEEKRAQANENFEKNVGPSFKRLIEEVVQHGAQEDIWLYFWDKWAPRYTPRIADKIWEIYKDYFKKLAHKI